MREIVTNNPFIRITIPFITGIIIGNKFHLSHSTIVLVFFFILYIVFSLLLLTKHNFKTNYTIDILIFVLFTTLGIYKIATTNIPIPELKKDAYYAQLISTSDTTKKHIKLKIKLYKTINKNLNKTINKQAIVYVKKNQKSKTLRPGDFITFNSKLQKIQNKHNPGEFDYELYAKTNNIYYTGFIQNTKWIKIKNSKTNLLNIISHIKLKTQELYAKYGITEKQQAILDALTLGDKAQLSNKTKKNFSNAGIMHILAVSGLHVGIVYLLIITLTSPLSKIKYGKNLILIITIFGIWLYASITGLSPSVNRAATMFTILSIGKFLNRTYASYNSIAFSAFIILYINPQSINSLGFQLSYIAVIGIVYLYPLISKLPYIKNKILVKIWQLTSISIAAQISTFPITIYYFHQFPLLFPISNLIMVPLATVIIYCSILLLSISQITLIANYLGEFTNQLIKILNSSTNILANLKFSTVQNIQITSVEMWILALIVVLSINFTTKTRYKNLRNTLILIITLMTFSVYKNFTIERSNQIIVFNTNNNTLILLRQGRNFITYPDSIPKNLAYFTKPLIDKYQLKRANVKAYPIFTINNKLGLIATKKNTYTNKKLLIEWLILGKNSPSNITELVQKTTPKEIIFDASSKKRQITHWKKQLTNFDIKTYDVKKRGAFIKTSNNTIFL